ncbi:TRAP transporter small permease subunit [Aeromicrobium sp. CTD01-1L150]|uniref:TRAP transporter small permease subunit n=1 Tax=Aeromicrobium sp. CTD01-1L150 TaxID=3341830 RepID=UPI0035C26E3F
MMLHVVADTVLRTVGRPLPSTMDIVSYWWLVLIAFMGLAGAERADAHLRAPVLFERVIPAHRRHWSIVAVVLAVGVTSVIAFLTLLDALEAAEIREVTGAVRTVVWPLRFVVPLGLTFYALQLLLRGVDVLRPRWAPDVPTRTGELV